MTDTENLCIIAMEECAELQQALSKALRFGFSRKRNTDDILTEYCQLIGVMEMIAGSGVLGQDITKDKMNTIKNNKIDKVHICTRLSKRLGTIH